MKKLFLFSLISVYFLNAQLHKPNNQNDAIEIVSESDNAVVMMIYMNGCGHCERLKPIFNSLAEEHPNVDFILVEYNKVPSLVKKHKIQGFPHTLYFNANSANSHDATQGANHQELKEKTAELSEKNK